MSGASAEIARARKLLARGEDVEAVLDGLSRALTQKMLHGALAELHSANGHDRLRMADTVARLFLRGNLPAVQDPAGHPTKERVNGASGDAAAPPAGAHRDAPPDDGES